MSQAPRCKHGKAERGVFCPLCHPKIKMKHMCRNPRCRDFTDAGFCPSCRYMGRRGMFLGGVIAGIVVAVWKLLV